MYVIITKNISKAVIILEQGRIVAFPTGTSYGLAADTLQGYALQRLRNLKRRPSTKTFTIFLKESLWHKYLKLSDQEASLLRGMSGHPLTLLVEPKTIISHLAWEGRIGLRIIDHPLMQTLAEAVAVPLTATSANVAGQKPCSSTPCLQQQFTGVFDPHDLNLPAYLHGADKTTYDLSLGAVIDGGTLPTCPPTTIAKISNNQISIIRLGSVSANTLNNFL